MSKATTRPLTFADRTPEVGDTGKPIDKRPTQSRYLVKFVWRLTEPPHQVTIREIGVSDRADDRTVYERNLKRWQYLSRADNGPITIALPGDGGLGGGGDSDGQEQ